MPVWFNNIYSIIQGFSTTIVLVRVEMGLTYDSDIVPVLLKYQSLRQPLVIYNPLAANTTP